MNSCGIYLISFNNYQYCYIGQSIKIKDRISKHRSLMKHNKHYNYRIQNAYNNYGDPTVDILEYCGIMDLTSKEEDWIIEFDTLNSGLNLRTAEFTSANGLSASQSKYTRECIEEAFFLLCMDKYVPYQAISSISGLSEGMVATIARGASHVWLKEEYPVEWEYMLSKLHTKKSAQHSFGFTYPTLVSPEGVEYNNINNLSSFAKTHNLHYGTLHKVCRGKEGCVSIKGWRIKK